MRIKTVHGIFGKDLGNILSNGYNAKKNISNPSKKDFASNLYAIPDQEKRNEYIAKYTKEILNHSDTEDKRYLTCKKLIKYLSKESGNHSNSKKISKQIAEAVEAFKEKSSSSRSTDSTSEFGSYPQADCSLSELKKEAKNKDKLKKLFKQCKADSQERDPELVEKIAQAKKNRPDGHAAFPYLENKIGNLNASKVQVGDNVKFVLSGNPKDKAEVAQHLYHAMIDQNCLVWFTLNECNDRPKFWTSKEISGLKLPNNWKVKALEEEIVSEKSSEKSAPRLIKTTLQASNGKTNKTLTHYHYDNWLDHKPAPCDKMLLRCAKIAKTYFEETGKSVGINCRAGVGRTGVLATLITGMCHIDKELSSGKPLNKATINPAELNYELRAQRRGIVSHSPQFIQVYRVLGDYAEEQK